MKIVGALRKPEHWSAACGYNLAPGMLAEKKVSPAAKCHTLRKQIVVRTTLMLTPSRSMLLMLLLYLHGVAFGELEHGKHRSSPGGSQIFQKHFSRVPGDEYDELIGIYFDTLAFSEVNPI